MRYIAIRMAVTFLGELQRSVRGAENSLTATYKTALLRVSSAEWVRESLHLNCVSLIIHLLQWNTEHAGAF